MPGFKTAATTPWFVVAALCAVAVGIAFALSQYGPTADGMAENMVVAAFAGVLTGVMAVWRARRRPRLLRIAFGVLVVNVAIAAAVLWWMIEIVTSLE